MKEIITIIAVTYNHGRILRGFCDNLMNQHGVEGRWKCIIAHDGTSDSSDITVSRSFRYSKEVVEAINSRYDRIFNPFRMVNSEQRENVWGHNLREISLKLVETPYVHITNADNQYCYGWLERLIPVLERDAPDMVLWNISHSYSEFHNWRPELQAGKIDFCNYALKTSVAQEVGFPWRHREADGAQVEAIRDRYPGLKVSRMENVFAFHN